MFESTTNSAFKGTITALIPAFNAGPFIGEALESVLAQSRLPDEVIVVDDCSTDNTAEVVRGFSNRRVKLLSTPKNSGSAIARNLGIGAASGDYVAFLDADDIWLPQHCATVAGLLDEHAEAALAFSLTEAFGDDHWSWRLYIEAHRPVFCFWECLRFTIVPQMNTIARRTTLLDIGGYRPELRQTQDFDLFLRLSYKHKFICSDQVTTHWRRHPGSITVRNPFRALGGEYISRHMFWKENHASMDPETLERFEEAVCDIWLSQVREAWDLCDYPALSFHISQHEFVTRSDRYYDGWVKRRRLFRFKQALESMPVGLRSLVAIAVRPLLS